MLGFKPGYEAFCNNFFSNKNVRSPSFHKASTTSSLDLCPEFMRDGGGAGLIFISHFTTVLPILEGISVEKSKLKIRQVPLHI